MTPIQERAKKLVDETTKRFKAELKKNPPGPGYVGLSPSHELGIVIALELQKVAPNDRELAAAVHAYMTHLAEENGCGINADHVCAWRGGRAERQ